MQIKDIIINLTIVLQAIDRSMILSKYLFLIVSMITIDHFRDSIMRVEKDNCYVDKINNLKLVHYLKIVTYDTTKINDTAVINDKFYIIAGNFLISKNADNQILKLNKLGFKKCYKFNFEDSEYYSVVVDTFRLPSESHALIKKLLENKVDYFIRN